MLPVCIKLSVNLACLLLRKLAETCVYRFLPPDQLCSFVAVTFHRLSPKNNIGWHFDGSVLMVNVNGIWAIRSSPYEKWRLIISRQYDVFHPTAQRRLKSRRIDHVIFIRWKYSAEVIIPRLSGAPIWRTCRGNVSGFKKLLMALLSNEMIFEWYGTSLVYSLYIEWSSIYYISVRLALYLVRYWVVCYWFRNTGV